MTQYEFIEFHESLGMHWFKPDTMRFFKSRVHDWYSDTGLFITSEKAPSDTARKYTVRQANFETGEVRTAPFTEFQQFTTLAAARKWVES